MGNGEGCEQDPGIGAACDTVQTAASGRSGQERTAIEQLPEGLSMDEKGCVFGILPREQADRGQVCATKGKVTQQEGEAGRNRP